MDIQEELILSYYKEIAVLNSKHKITVVQHQHTNQIFVKKVLDVFNLDIYTSLKDNPIGGLPRIYEAVPDNDKLIIIEEYVSGQNLEQMLNENGPLSERDTIMYTTQLCEILSALHSHTPSIIHRDIKPTNIIITPFNSLVLIDLNAAKYESEKDQDTRLLGTMGYAAPEQYGFGSSGVQTDIYAVGMLMNTMLTGELSSQVISDSKLSKVITKCTELNPKSRYGSINELLRAIKSMHVIGDKVFPRKWMSFLPPGFRSLNPIYMIFAGFMYYFIFYCCLFLTVKNASPNETNLLRYGLLMMFLFIVFYTSNYLEIQSHMTIFKKESRPLKYLNIIIIDLMAVAITMILLMAASFMII